MLTFESTNIQTSSGARPNDPRRDKAAGEAAEARREDPPRGEAHRLQARRHRGLDRGRGQARRHPPPQGMFYNCPNIMINE